MVRKDTNAGFYQEKSGCLHRPLDKYTFTTGGRDALLRHYEKTWWVFRGEFWWEDERYDQATMHAVIMERVEKEQKRLDKLRREYGTGE